MKMNSKSGFSLVELMVVVAIIGILATIAAPNYIRFQAKAKQANAKSELAGIYTAEKAFYAEYGTYNAGLPRIGYIPDGSLPSGAVALNSTSSEELPVMFAMVFDGMESSAFAASGTASVNRYYASGFDGGFKGTTNVWESDTAGQAPVPAAGQNAVYYVGNAPGLATATRGGLATYTASANNGPTGSALTQDTFTAGSTGKIGNSGLDGWTCNQDKKMNNSTQGF